MSQLFTYKYKSNIKTFQKYADIIFAILLAPAHMWLGSTATEDGSYIAYTYFLMLHVNDTVVTLLKDTR